MVRGAEHRIQTADRKVARFRPLWIAVFKIPAENSEK
jgi:hypothetical protein